MSVEQVYIAGPMAGYEDFNYPAFYAAEKRLEDLGYLVINPARLDEHDKALTHSGDYTTGDGVRPRERAAFLKRDIESLIECDGLVLLDHWANSLGANVELTVARSAGLWVGRYTGGHLVRSEVRPYMGLVELHISQVMSDVQ